MSRSINKCHFLPRKPGVIAYAGEETIWIVTITNTFRICFIFPTVFNRGLITSGVILPLRWLAVKSLRGATYDEAMSAHAITVQELLEHSNIMITLNVYITCYQRYNI